MATVHDLVRPGPDRIQPGCCPGGVVLQVYNRRHELLAQDHVTTPGQGPSDLVVESSRQEPGDVCLVVYDGDSGLRWTPEDYTLAGLGTGWYVADDR